MLEMVYARPELDVEYDAVVLVDGLSRAERKAFKTAAQLEDYLRSESVPTYRADCGNAAGLYELIRILTEKAHAGERFLLHFICHGSESGIWLGEEFVAFGALTAALEGLNAAVDHTLILNMSSCRGLNGVRIVDPESSNVPFFGLIGSKRDLLLREIPEINQRMYFRWLSGDQVNDLVRNINHERGEEVLYGISAEGYRHIRRAEPQEKAPPP